MNPGNTGFFSHARFYSSGEVERLLRKAGFEIEDIDSCAGFLCGRFARRPEQMIGLQAKSSPGKPGNPPVADLGQNPKNNSDSLEKRGKSRSFFVVRCSSFISRKNQ